MRKAQDIIGLPIIEVEAGKQLGIAKDFLVDDDWNAYGILLETKHWFSSPKYIHWDKIISIGKDAVTIPDERVVKSMEDSLEIHSFLNGSSKIKGLPMITVNGHQLGTVEDVYLGKEMGKKIIGFELTDGFISDLKEGRRWLRAPEKITMGEDAIIIPVHCDRDLEEIITSTNE